MAEQQNPSTPSQPEAPEGPESAREGVSERGGEGGYGNDTGFATGTQAATDDERPVGPGDRHADGGGVAGGQSGREQQVSDTYRDAGQGGDSLDGTS